jgi:hypothetical protein
MIYLQKDSNDPLLNAICQSIGYNGTKFRVEVIKDTIFHMHDTSWSDGSRTSYALFNIDKMATAILPNFHPVFDGQVIPNKIEVAPGYIVVEHSIFRGKDMGITLHVHSDNYKVFELPIVAELSQSEQVVLSGTKCLKAFCRKDEAARYKVTAKMYENAKNNLIAKGYLSKNGAITISGKNVAETIKLPQYYNLGADWQPS